MKRYLSGILILCMLAFVSGCNSKAESQTEITQQSSIASCTADYSEDDYYFDWQSQAKTVSLSDGTQTITASGVYELQGTMSDGSVVVNVDKSTDKGTVYLVLNNTSINSSNSAPILVEEAKKVVLILENGTTNTITQGESCTVDESGNPSAAIFSKANLTITGGGTLIVNTGYNDGITSKDSLKITDGTINITAKADGMVGKDLVAVKSADITIDAGKDGIRSTNDTDEGKGNVIIDGGVLNITAANDGLSAAGILQTTGGDFHIVTGKGYSSATTRANGAGPGGFGGTQGTPPQGGGQKGTPPQGGQQGGMQPAGEQPTLENMAQDGNVTAEAQTGTETEEESKKGMKAVKGIVILGGSFNISSYDDAIHSESTITVGGGEITAESGDDGIHSDESVIISGGTVAVGNAYEGIEGINITISGGKVTLNASDDGVNVNDKAGVLTISGGDIYMNAGGDGLDSNGSIQVSGGTITVDGPTNDGNGALDTDGSFAISGGTLIAAGSSGMAEAPDTSSTQLSMLMYYTSTQTAGTKITLKDSDGKEVVSFTPAKQYQSVVISSPSLKTGKAYTLYSNGTKIVEVTLSGAVTTLNESGVTERQQGMGGGQRGNRTQQ